MKMQSGSFEPGGFLVNDSRPAPSNVLFFSTSVGNLRVAYV